MRFARSRTRAAVLLLVLVVVGGLVLAGHLDSPSRARRPTQRLPDAAALERAMTVAGIERHMAALQRIAARDGGNRAAGTRGYRDSATYVADQLRAAGWRVREHPFSFPYFGERSPAVVLAGGRRIHSATLRYSGSGVAIGRPVPVGSGCQASDYGAVRDGGIALVERSDCLLRQTALAAQRAGAGAVLVYNADHAGPAIPATLLRPGVSIPTVGIGRRAGALLRRRRPRLRVRVNALTARRSDTNVLAELGSGRRVVMAGAHLDSVAQGPGVNDNGSGVATLLGFAERVGRARPRPRVRLRLAFWSGEELGLYGSRAYVHGLSHTQRRAIEAYLNLDMVGSANGGRFMYDGTRGAARLEAQAVRQLFAARHEHLRQIDVGDSSDHAAFAHAGVPVIGLFSGGAEIKSKREARWWGGRAEQPFDSCYHLSCDTLARVDSRTLAQLSDAVAVALFRLGWR